MKSIRLLPVVVFASLALLAFKTIGLVTSGSYVLTGTSSAVAAGGGAAEPASGETLTIPPEPTLEDKAPTLSDGAPTMPLAAPAAAGGHGEGAPAPATEGEHGAESAAAPAAEEAIATGAPDMTAEAPAAQPEGQQIGETERTILNRLAERRSELNGIEGELATRQQLVEAAERKLAERTAALQAIEARINGLVDQQKSIDEAQFKSLVSMYENMKPADAAKIFDALDIDVLLRVAKAINPRKMAPIMAKMNPTVAQVLTVKLAAVNPVTQPTTMASTDLNAELPQIVGQ
ncbi:MotE family protein [Paradevosia shaoguanensis]|uniref:MotE family protein n=1 Tax=Paradevosia shaoguanensis TaxID=1335043 RepID=UPI0019348C37|nr:hypothetical protein [Paradevosia shaoguanensis]